MDRMDFYLTPLIEINHEPTIEIERRIYKYCNLIESLIKETILNLPHDYFEFKFINDMQIGNCLYNEKIGLSRDIIEYFSSTLMQLSSSDEPLETIIKMIDDVSDIRLIALVGLERVRYIKYQELYIDSQDKITLVFRYYILRARNFEEYIDLMGICFPNVIFHTRIFTTIRNLGSISDHNNELCRHLSILNDYGKELFIENKSDLVNFYNILKSKYNILCSGKGSNEGLDKYLCKFEDEQGNQIIIRCNPHTKLYSAHSDYRIYFNFGRTDIQNGKILIGHIGRHWN